MTDPTKELSQVVLDHIHGMTRAALEHVAVDAVVLSVLIEAGGRDPEKRTAEAAVVCRAKIACVLDACSPPAIMATARTLAVMEHLIVADPPTGTSH